MLVDVEIDTAKHGETPHLETIKLDLRRSLISFSSAKDSQGDWTGLKMSVGKTYLKLRKTFEETKKFLKEKDVSVFTVQSGPGSELDITRGFNAEAELVIYSEERNHAKIYDQTGGWEITYENPKDIELYRSRALAFNY